MSRLVTSGPLGADGRQGAGPLDAPLAINPGVLNAPTLTRDDYLTRVAKYIPVEFVGGYVFFQKLISFDAISPLGPGFYIPFSTICIFTLVLWLAIPFYFKYHGNREKKNWRTQAVVSIAAFPIWVYAIGGSLIDGIGQLFPAQSYGYDLIHATYLPAGLLVLFSTLSGFFDQ